MRRVTDDERRARLARRHRLLPAHRVDSVPVIADSLVALHSSDPATVYLSIAARSNTLTTTDIEGALYDERAVVRHHAQSVELDDGEGITLADEPEVDPVDDHWVAVLPGLDPTAMGWKQRGWYLDDATAARVVDRFGNIGPTIWADGRIAGGWVQRPDGELAVGLTTDIGRDRHALLDDELARIADFIGSARFKVRFPSPNQAALLG